jgi:hypothetical protein
MTGAMVGGRVPLEAMIKKGLKKKKKRERERGRERSEAK